MLSQWISPHTHNGLLRSTCYSRFFLGPIVRLQCKTSRGRPHTWKFLVCREANAVCPHPMERSLGPAALDLLMASSVCEFLRECWSSNRLHCTTRSRHVLPFNVVPHPSADRSGRPFFASDKLVPPKTLSLARVLSRPKRLPCIHTAPERQLHIDVSPERTWSLTGAGIEAAHRPRALSAPRLWCPCTFNAGETLLNGTWHISTAFKRVARLLSLNRHANREANSGARIDTPCRLPWPASAI